MAQDYFLFLDECGDHNLKTIDPGQPIFCLAGILMSPREHEEMTKKVNTLKKRYFERTDVILHSYKIRRRDAAFRILNNDQIRKAFLEDMNQTLRSGFRVISCSVNKLKHRDKYSEDAMNPYLLSLGILMERVVYFLDREGIPRLRIIAESIGKKENQLLQWTFLQIKMGAFAPFKIRNIEGRQIDLHFHRKKENIVGLQVADLVAYPLAKTHQNNAPHLTYIKVVEPNILYGRPDINFKRLP